MLKCDCAEAFRPVCEHGQGLREGGTDEHDQKVYSCGRRYGGCDLVLADFVIRREITQSQRAVVQRGSGLHEQARQGWLGDRHAMHL